MTDKKVEKVDTVTETPKKVDDEDVKLDSKNETREKIMNDLLNSLRLLPSDINRLIVEYERIIKYHSKPVQTWKLPTNAAPQGLVTDGALVYLCDHTFSCLYMYTIDGYQDNRQSPTLEGPSDIDIYQNNLYIIDKKQVVVMNLLFQIQSSFSVPDSPTGWNHLKVDINVIFISIQTQNQIFVYSKDGKVKTQLGPVAGGTRRGEFNAPRGLTRDKNFLYVCDYYNHRCQSIGKDDYQVSRVWGSEGAEPEQFSYPYAITFYEDIIYVGDQHGVQVFSSTDGTFLQKIGDRKEGTAEGQFKASWGICILGDRLYVSDKWNGRIQVFKRMTINEIEQEALKK